MFQDTFRELPGQIIEHRKLELRAISDVAADQGQMSVGRRSDVAQRDLTNTTARKQRRRRVEHRATDLLRTRRHPRPRTGAGSSRRDRFRIDHDASFHSATFAHTSLTPEHGTPKLRNLSNPEAE
jgi:hypothetical protein